MIVHKTLKIEGLVILVSSEALVLVLVERVPWVVVVVEGVTFAGIEVTALNIALFPVVFVGETTICKGLVLVALVVHACAQNLSAR